MTAPRPTDFPVRFSRLKQMAKSALHYRDSLIFNRECGPYRKGTALHSYLIGGAEVVIYNGRRDARIKAYQDFMAEHIGKTILIESEARDVMGMRDAIEKHDDAMLALRGTRERELEFSFGGRKCAARPDVFTDLCVTELKTDRSSHPDRFAWRGRQYGYHAQLAWYLQAVRLSGLGKPQDATIVAVESTRPYPVTVLDLTRRALDQGERLCRLWFEELRGCEENDSWPGYAQGRVLFDVPDEEDDGFTVRIAGEELEVA